MARRCAHVGRRLGSAGITRHVQEEGPCPWLTLALQGGHGYTAFWNVLDFAGRRHGRGSSGAQLSLDPLPHPRVADGPVGSLSGVSPGGLARPGGCGAVCRPPGSHALLRARPLKRPLFVTRACVGSQAWHPHGREQSGSSLLGPASGRGMRWREGSPEPETGLGLVMSHWVKVWPQHPWRLAALHLVPERARDRPASLGDACGARCLLLSRRPRWAPEALPCQSRWCCWNAG